MQDREGAELFSAFVAPWLRRAWALAMRSNSPSATAQLLLVPEALRLEEKSVREVTVALNNPTPLHVKRLQQPWHDCGVRAFVVTRGWGGSLQGGSHVLFDAENKFAIIVEDNESVIALIGSFCRLLHGNLAALRGDRLVLAASTSEDVIHKRGCWVGAS
eukprot:2970297-Pleurochrysis_carterae.AAC.1